MRLAHQFQRQMVKGQGYLTAGAYRVGQTRRPHCLLVMLSTVWNISLLNTLKAYQT